MKKHLVLVTGGYFPNPSPTGKCAHDYINLLKKDYDVDVICISGGGKNPYDFDGEKVNPVGSKYYFFRKWADKKFGNPVINTVLKIPGRILRPFVHPKNFRWFEKAAWKKLEQIHKTTPVDVVFSSCAPAAAHAAAARFKKSHPAVRWVAYTVDSYTAQQSGSTARKVALKYERKLLSGADKVLLSEEIFSSMKNLYNGFEEKCMVLPYLMPERAEVKPEKFFLEEGKINLVYVGRFYKKLRRPEFLLETALGLGDKYALNLFSGGACGKVVRKFAEKSAGRIINRPWASPEDIRCIYEQADILVNVGNRVPEFKPSKIFEYISTGKPIINFYYPGLRDEALAKNPLVLQVEMRGDASAQTEKIRTFVDSVYKKRLDKQEIDKIYHNHCKDNIRKILCGCAK